MRARARWTAGAAAAAAAIVVALLAGPLTSAKERLLAWNLYPDVGSQVFLNPGAEACQDGETVPAGARQLVVHVKVGAPFVNGGPIGVVVYSDGEPVLRSATDTPFRAGSVAAPLDPPARDIADATICFTNRGEGPFALSGFDVRDAGRRDMRYRYFTQPALVDGEPAFGRATIQYPLRGHPSALDMTGRIADRAGLFKSDAIRGWALWGALGLLVAALGLGLFAAMRRPRRAALMVATAAALSACGWALLTPTFQVPDELPHYGHAGYIAETGERPSAIAFQWHSNEEMDQIEFGMPWGYVTDPFWTEANDREVRTALERDLGRVDAQQAGFTVNVPPLYYLYGALPYRAAYDGTLLDRVLAMRLWTALLAGVLAALLFAFVREVLPGRPLAAGAGAFAASVHPMVGHISGGVSPDVLLWVCSAAVFVLIARAFRRGLSWRIGLAIGLIGFAGAVTKPAMATLAPGVALALALLILRARGERRTALLGAVAAGVAAIVPYALWHFAGQSLLGSGTAVGGGFASTETRNQPLELREFVSYVWQYHLPRLPFMNDLFPGSFGLWDTYFKGFVGRFGWHQYGFGDGTHRLALGVALALIAAAGVTLARARSALRGRIPEAVAYLGLFLGVVVMVSAAGYRYVSDVALSFEQARYLFPALLPLYALTVGLAVHALGRRRALPLAAFVLTLLAGHALAGQLLTVERFYL